MSIGYESKVTAFNITTEKKSKFDGNNLILKHANDIFKYPSYGLACHGSHNSHSSHESHYSHRSHYSG